MPSTRTPEAQAALDYWSREHSQSARVIPESQTDADDRGHDHRYALARHIAAYSPESVLEFGCSSGRNLAILRSLVGPSVQLVGIDPNERAVEAGRTAHPTIEYLNGADAGLPAFRDGSADVVFTCSVLDHIPAPEWRSVYDQLKRIAARAFVLLEPILDDRLGGWTDADLADLQIPAAPYSYVHDYLDHDRDLRLVRQVAIQAPLWPHFGALYHLMEWRRT